MSPHDDPREQRLDEAANALPRELAPPDELLGRVQAAIAARRVRELPGAVASAAWLPAHRSRRLAAAAALLVVGALAGAAAVGLALRSGSRETAAAPGTDPSRTGAPTPLTRVSLAQFDAYDRAATDLGELLARQRASLRPETIAVIEHSLRQIDDALADVKQALARDPGSATLTDRARRLYDLKLDLLKRSTALAAS